MNSARPIGLALGLILAASACSPAPSAGPALADRQAIDATLARYTRGLDQLDADLYLSAFAPDGAVVVYQDVFQGEDALRKLVTDEAELRRTEPRTLLHMEANSSVEFTAPDRAVHHAYWLTFARTGAGAEPGSGDLSVIGAGVQTDELHKIDGEWLIVKRTITDGP